MAESTGTRHAKQEEGSPSKNPGNSTSIGPWVTILISIGSAILTTILAPYLIESIKTREAEQQRERDKEDRIISNQFDCIEKSSAVFWKYRQAAGFLMFDFLNGQRDKALLKQHIRDFNDLSVLANADLPAQAFRARMYFNSEYVYQRLRHTYYATFAKGSVDDVISRQLLKDEYTPHPETGPSHDAWMDIANKIEQLVRIAEQDFNAAFAEIGKIDIDSKHGPQGTKPSPTQGSAQQ